MATATMKSAPPMEIASDDKPAVVVGSTSVAAASSASTEVPSPNKKRPAADDTPSMPKAAAAKALSSLKVPKAKKQSQYVRFKSLLLQDAKKSGDDDTVKGITQIAKDAWAIVKNMAPPAPIDPTTNTNDPAAPSAAGASNLSPDTQRYLRIKGRAIKQENDDNAKSNADLKTFCTAFVIAAISHLQWETIGATEDSFSSLSDAVDRVIQMDESRPFYWPSAVDKAPLVKLEHWSSAVDKAPLLKSLKEAKAQLAHFREMKSEGALVAQLRNATDEELLQHAKEHRRLLAQVGELNVIKMKKKAQDERQREAEERELSNADSIKDEITRALSKQMKYGQNLKWSSQRITYQRGGISEKVFAKAFKVAVGTKQATIRSSEVELKYLRFGAHLECTQVTVNLSGKDLTATTSYRMVK